MKKLLIVEDSEHFRRLLVDMLGHYYDKIYECSDGMEAPMAYKKIRPDCVLMDVQMEQVDGLTATRQLKYLYPDARIVLMSQFNDQELQDEARTAGAERAIPKERIAELRTIFSNKRAN